MAENAEALWDRLSSDYLGQVKRALRKTDHPRRREIVEDLRNHLRARFADLPSGERTLENMRVIIEEMGSPSEYVDALSPDAGASHLSALMSRRKVRYAIYAVLVLGVIGLVLLWPAKALAVLNVAVLMLIAAILTVNFARTRNSGFLWLMVALVVWPLASSVVGAVGVRPAIDRLIAGDEVGYFPFSLVERGHIALGSLLTMLMYFNRLVRSALLIIAIVKLGGGRLSSAREGALAQ